MMGETQSSIKFNGTGLRNHPVLGNPEEGEYWRFKVECSPACTCFDLSFSGVILKIPLHSVGCSGKRHRLVGSESLLCFLLGSWKSLSITLRLPRTAEVAVCFSTCAPFPVTPGSVMERKKGKYKNIQAATETPSGHFTEPHSRHFPGASQLRES